MLIYSTILYNAYSIESKGTFGVSGIGIIINDIFIIVANSEYAGDPSTPSGGGNMGFEFSEMGVIWAGLKSDSRRDWEIRYLGESWRR